MRYCCASEKISPVSQPEWPGGCKAWVMLQSVHRDPAASAAENEPAASAVFWDSTLVLLLQPS